MDTNKALAFLTWYKKNTEKYLSAFVEDRKREAEVLHTVIGESWNNFASILKRGKRFRGALVVLGYKLAGGGDVERILRTSLFMEVIHAGVLVQDDIMDRDEKRRGVMSLHKQVEIMGQSLGVSEDATHYGESVAVSIADASFFMGWKMLFRSGFEFASILNAGDLVSDCLVRTAYGQVLDLTVSSIDEADEKDILKMMRLKTSEYTTITPMLVGVALAGKKKDKFSSLVSEFGLCLGWAFQIRDDILGLYGDEKEMGKPVGSDLKEAKKTLLILEAKRMASPNQWKILDGILGNQSIGDSEIELARKIIKDCGAYESVLAKANVYLNNGLALVPRITKDKKLREILASFLRLMVNRSS